MSVPPEVFPGLLSVASLLALSAFFSSSETALFSLTRSQVARMRVGGRGERAAATLLDDPQRLLSTIIIGNLFVNVFLVSIMADLADLLFGPAGVKFSVIPSTILLLVFGEVTPKTLAVGKAAALSRLVSLPLSLLAVIFSPLRLMLKTAANGVLFALGQHRLKGWPGVTRDEVAAVVALGEAQGVATSEERALMDNILDVTTVDARALMVPRTEVVAVEDSVTVAEAFAVSRGACHSRLPVYHDDLDDSWGIFSAVDVLRSKDDQLMSRRLSDFRAQVRGSATPLPDVPIYPALLAPETARVDQLLDEMRERRASAALIVDEYGGTSGLLTIDDLLAEIVGRSPAADDSGEDGIFRQEGGAWLEGQTLVRDFARKLGVELTVNGADTMGGYVMEKLGRIPRAGDKVGGKGWELEVLKMAGRRVGTLSFRIFPEVEMGE